MDLMLYCSPINFPESDLSKPGRLCRFWRAVSVFPPGVYRLSNENPGFSFAPGIISDLSV